MAIKKTKIKQTTSATPVAKARSLWLAGWGVVSKAQKRGGKLLNGLIGEGKDLHARTRKLALEIGSDAKAQVKGALAPVRVAAKQNVDKVTTAVQRGIAGALAKLGIPSKADVEELTRRVTALSRQLKSAK